MPLEKLVHVPVLHREIVEGLVTPETRSVFDGTLGLGGHAKLILNAHPGVEKYLGSDLDQQHLAEAQHRLGDFASKLSTFNTNFSDLGDIIAAEEVPRPLVILLDLGICSNHVDDPRKGFSFAENGPLKMCFDQENSSDCSQIVNEYSAEDLRIIFRKYGEEPHAHKISQKITEKRRHKRIETTHELRDIIEENVFPRDRKRSLTRVFQALRIAVNEELFHLEKALEAAVSVMESGDRMGVISYHSLEDRIVKQFFALQAKAQTVESTFSLHEEVAPACFALLTKKPILPCEEEIAENPRARSAKLRILQKI